ncbi:P-loop containing nucleoside triphosphate hydrolase protein [Zopfia rhizophila CBS 207.26]|uniref:P-loop containing nucleoside triphosphate hydrolase protein n=1 Tax=Zopfia rhizophila CBS 207.26 TaxID=1314779 RepID=A0A6A6EIB3_9PEZI|nr:P-loop containing nucleoside triphosphate hydrolase protein [Zopfia rhizophila CBS 207.26]
MDTIEEPPDEGSTVIAGSNDDPFRLRSYQAEMVEESLKANIIVVMDTGSGKTHIALARTAAELEKCEPDQLVWFLAPTVPLCEQQYRVFKSHLPAFGIRVLSGRDNVDHWTDQTVWDAVLKNIRIVLSTHQVLLDALTHAFVKMSKLALIIFDEAHHCTMKHPANRIMTNFYRPLALAKNAAHLPRILGLSASPVMKANAGRNDLQKIEQNLNSIAKTPKQHRSELIRFVHRPELLNITYPKVPHGFSFSHLLAPLQQAYDNYNLMKDPYVIDLFAKKCQGHEIYSDELDNVFVSGETYCRKQLRSLVEKGKAMLDELGASAADWYLRQCIAQYEKLIRNSHHQQFTNWSDQEKQYLSSIFKALKLSEDLEFTPMSLDHISPKAQALIDLLGSESASGFTGLVFVEQRVCVATLAELLSVHPQTGRLFNIGTFVGTSQSTKRKTNVADLAEPRNQQDTLDDFRTGKKNLILTTSVLEEGIDVSSCHIVICFEPPKNLKSFIQRRGRARKQKSKYIILIPEFDSKHPSPEHWNALEEEMKAAYLNNLREVKLAEERELIEEDALIYYEVPNTGALLTLDNASQHLHHFCAKLTSSPYVDSRPQFTFIEDDNGEIKAEVTLPISVDPAVRRAGSSASWMTERIAKKDAAFHAYKALHLAGLVNDNLLPLDEEDDAPELNISDYTPSLIEVSPEFDPWITIAECQRNTPQVYHRVLLNLTAVGEKPLSMVFLTPCQMPALPPVILHWNKTKRYAVESSLLSTTTLTHEELLTMRAITKKLLHSAFSGRMAEERHDFLCLFVPSDPQELLWDQKKLQQWNIDTDGFRSASDRLDRIERGIDVVSDFGWIRLLEDERKFILKGIVHEPTCSSDIEDSGPQFEVTRLSKRRDFLHRIPEENAENAACTRIELLNVRDCRVNNLPSAYSIFALFVPSILHQYETFLIAETLRNTLLASVSIDTTRLDLIVKALTSSNRDTDDNYQRLEFLGDCILKFITSVHLMAAHPSWPEGFLTNKKGQIVSNGSLTRATMKAGLDQFILTKRFTGAKWQPRYAGDVLGPRAPPEKRRQSSKLLADVVESLIGASYVEGGFANAFACIKTLLPLESWIAIPDSNTILFDTAPSEFEPAHLSTLESLIGYTFNKKILLLEALTHASYTGPIANYCSYERMEFLGDAVLEYIISKRLFAHTTELSHITMHSIRTSMVNASFLALRMFETTMPEERINVHVDLTSKEIKGETEIVQKALWQFMRHNSPHLIDAQAAAAKRHAATRDQIIDALQHDKVYPWHLLALTDPEKIFSDTVESVIGAIYVDSKGDISSCEKFVKNLGILDCLERILRDGVDCLHPKERLGHLAVERRVEYVNLGRNEENGMYRCQVKVGGEEIGVVVEGLKRLNAETVAAWKAVKIIEGVDEVDMSEDEVFHDALEDGEDGGVSLEMGWAM